MHKSWQKKQSATLKRDHRIEFYQETVPTFWDLAKVSHSFLHVENFLNSLKLYAISGLAYRLTNGDLYFVRLESIVEAVAGNAILLFVIFNNCQKI